MAPTPSVNRTSYPASENAVAKVLSALDPRDKIPGAAPAAQRAVVALRSIISAPERRTGPSMCNTSV
jgi:hypothetical protein